eukprot:TRINITY_DN7370_c0_g2_i1.p1 TRINITY_DN7370_c0_g2~~TRINITY_DN7370_c0_g2_i1.p1  ORF type:complete len:794 (-),score=148.11 TRINITY_DN7370_c0_g2_i1:171-2522(-)
MDRAPLTPSVNGRRARMMRRPAAAVRTVLLALFAAAAPSGAASDAGSAAALSGRHGAASVPSGTAARDHNAAIEVLGQAQAAGVPTHEYASEHSRLKSGVATELRSLLAEQITVANFNEVGDAMQRVTRVGLQPSEVDSLHGDLIAKLRAQLKQAATAANTTRTSVTIEGLADAIYVAQKLGGKHDNPLEPDMEAARADFWRHLEAGFGAKDLAYMEVAVRCAPKAKVSPMEMGVWVQKAQALKASASQETATLQQLLGLLKDAKAQKLETLNASKVIEAKAQRLFDEEMKNALSANASQLDIGRISALIAQVRAIDATGFSFAAVEEKLRSHVVAEWKRVLADPISESNFNAVGDALRNAASVGLQSPGVESLRSDLVAKLRAQLKQAATAANTTRTGLTIEGLADAIYVAQKLGGKHDNSLEPDMEAARADFWRHLEAGFGAKDLAYMEVAVRCAPKAKVSPMEMGVWVRKAQDLQALASQDSASVHHLLDMLKHAKEHSLHHLDAFKSVEARALKALDEELQQVAGQVGSDVDVDKISATIAKARSAGANGSNVELAKRKLHQHSIDNARNALSNLTANTYHVVGEAFERATRSGLEVAELEPLQKELSVKLKADIARAMRAANSTRTGETIESLADSIYVAHKLAGKGTEDLAEDLDNARAAYWRQLESGFAAKDLEYMEVAVRCAPRARVSPKEMGEWVALSLRLRKAATEEESSGAHTLDAKLHLLREAERLGIQHAEDRHLAAVAASARRLASAKLRGEEAERQRPQQPTGPLSEL